ncbi:MAG: glycosyltransferase [Bacteroidales bacterium]|nr:glycosyltransferase [Bacteroidales bacterium]
MYSFIILSMIVCLFYGLQIIIYIYGFNKQEVYNRSKNNIINEYKTYLSVIIPFKNEEKKLPSLIKNLQNQSLNTVYFEILFINDHSSDDSEQIVKRLIKDINHFSLISLTTSQKGKKEAIKEGISHAKGELIVTSDADCNHQPNWLEELFFFYSENNPKMIIAPVLMTGNSFFQRIQSLEFLSLTGSTAGAAGIKHPIMCNGANLAFEKDVFFEFEDVLNNKEASGDDVFLLHNIKKKYRKDIYYLKSNNAVVNTEAENSLKSFFKQRIRWASKSKSYTDFDTILSSFIVLFINLLIVGLFIGSFFNSGFFTVFISVFILKMLIDFIILYLTAVFFKQKKLLVFFPILVIFYPFYIAFTGIFSFFVKSVNWKN